MKKRYLSNYLNEVRMSIMWNVTGNYLKLCNGKLFKAVGQQMESLLGGIMSNMFREQLAANLLGAK